MEFCFRHDGPMSPEPAPDSWLAIRPTWPDRSRRGSDKMAALRVAGNSSSSPPFSACRSQRCPLGQTQLPIRKTPARPGKKAEAGRKASAEAGRQGRRQPGCRGGKSSGKGSGRCQTARLSRFQPPGWTTAPIARRGFLLMPGSADAGRRGLSRAKGLAGAKVSRVLNRLQSLRLRAGKGLR